MISFDAKPEATSSSLPLNTLPQEEGESTLSFSDLLQGIVTKKGDKNALESGPLLLSLEDTQEQTTGTKQTKNDILLSLLKGETLQEDEISLELNPKITQTLTQDELKTLIQDAKQYLKEKLISSDDFKRSEIKELPKTLKGLAKVATKYSIDISKITLEEVQAEVKTVPKEQKETLKQQTPVLLDTDEREVKLQSTKKVQQATDENLEKVDLQEENKVDKRVTTTLKELKTTPLFKAQTMPEHTTQEMVQTKLQTIEQKNPKQKVDETLKLLLRGEKVSKKDNTGLTADFSVATAKVIAPSAPTQTEKTLESLLKGDGKEEMSTASKVDTISTPKADSFEVKLNEAKQLTKYLSQDVKTAIDDYKSPFTRVKVQLNPKHLGEVDLTIVQRGKNLHINLSSNNVAINTLAMNANDLKVQLQNNGINNASLNFSNSSQGGDASSAGQQNQHHQQREAGEEYNYFSQEEENEEILSSLEIVVANYA